MVWHISDGFSGYYQQIGGRKEVKKIKKLSDKINNKIWAIIFYANDSHQVESYLNKINELLQRIRQIDLSHFEDYGEKYIHENIENIVTQIDYIRALHLTRSMTVQEFRDFLHEELESQKNQQKLNEKCALFQSPLKSLFHRATGFPPNYLDIDFLSSWSAALDHLIAISPDYSLSAALEEMAKRYIDSLSLAQIKKLWTLATLTHGYRYTFSQAQYLENKLKENPGYSVLLLDDHDCFHLTYSEYDEKGEVRIYKYKFKIEDEIQILGEQGEVIATKDLKSWQHEVNLKRPLYWRVDGANLLSQVLDTDQAAILKDIDQLTDLLANKEPSFFEKNIADLQTKFDYFFSPSYMPTTSRDKIKPLINFYQNILTTLVGVRFKDRSDFMQNGMHAVVKNKEIDWFSLTGNEKEALIQGDMTRVYNSIDIPCNQKLVVYTLVVPDGSGDYSHHMNTLNVLLKDRAQFNILSVLLIREDKKEELLQMMPPPVDARLTQLIECYDANTALDLVPDLPFPLNNTECLEPYKDAACMVEVSYSGNRSGELAHHLNNPPSAIYPEYDVMPFKAREESQYARKKIPGTGLENDYFPLGLFPRAGLFINEALDQAYKKGEEGRWEALQALPVSIKTLLFDSSSPLEMNELKEFDKSNELLICYFRHLSTQRKFIDSAVVSSDSNKNVNIIAKHPVSRLDISLSFLAQYNVHKITVYRLDGEKTVYHTRLNQGRELKIFNLFPLEQQDFFNLSLLCNGSLIGTTGDASLSEGIARGKLVFHETARYKDDPFNSFIGVTTSFQRLARFYVENGKPFEDYLDLVRTLTEKPKVENPIFNSVLYREMAGKMAKSPFVQLGMQAARKALLENNTIADYIGGGIRRAISLKNLDKGILNSIENSAVIAHDSFMPIARETIITLFKERLFNLIEEKEAS